MAHAEPDRRSLDLGLLALRLGAGAFMLVHGLPKLMSFAERASRFPDPLGVGSPMSLALAIFGEVFCSLFLILGLGARLFAVPYAFTMLVAGFVVHAGDPWEDREKAMLFLLLAVVVALTGPGRFSLDAWLRRRRAG